MALESAPLDQYKTTGRISFGGFGAVDLGEGPNGEPVAIKKELALSKVTRPVLAHEYNVYKTLGPHSSLPEIKAYGTDGQFNVLVMDLLGPSVGSLFWKCGKKFSFRTVLSLGIGMLDAIYYMHSKGVIHRDIKPDNFLLGRTGRRINLVDFGIARQYWNPHSESHAPYHEGVSFLGTLTYASLGAHLGQAQSRRDDLQSLCYVLLQLVRGSLPWEGLRGGTDQHRMLRTQEKKRHWSPDRLCAGYGELKSFVTHCFSLGWDEDPDYSFLRGELTDIIHQHDWKADAPYEWEEPGWTPSEPEVNLCAQGSEAPNLAPQVQRGDLVLLRLSPLETLEFDHDTDYSPLDPSYTPHPQLPGSDSGQWNFPYRPAVVREATMRKDDRFLLLNVYPILKRSDGLSGVATRRQAMFKPLPNLGNDILQSAFVYTTSISGRFAVPYPVTQNCGQIPLALSDADLTQLEREMGGSVPPYQTAYTSDDEATRDVYESMPSVWTGCLQPVVDILPLSPETLTQENVDVQGANGWMKEIIAVDAVRREEDGDLSDSDSDSDSEIDSKYWDWGRPRDRRLSCTMSITKYSGGQCEAPVPGEST